jgi:hypothetical protein
MKSGQDLVTVTWIERDADVMEGREQEMKRSGVTHFMSILSLYMHAHWKLYAHTPTPLSLCSRLACFAKSSIDRWLADEQGQNQHTSIYE